MNRLEIFNRLVDLKKIGYNFSITYSGWSVHYNGIVIREAKAIVPMKSLVADHAYAAMIAAQLDAEKRFEKSSDTS